MKTQQAKLIAVAREILAHSLAAHETYQQSSRDGEASDALRSISQAWDDALRIFNHGCARVETSGVGRFDIAALYRALAASLLDIGDAKHSPERASVFKHAGRIAAARL
jgi:hypothetical protein